MKTTYFFPKDIKRIVTRPYSVLDELVYHPARTIACTSVSKFFGKKDKILPEGFYEGKSYYALDEVEKQTINFQQENTDVKPYRVIDGNKIIRYAMAIYIMKDDSKIYELFENDDRMEVRMQNILKDRKKKAYEYAILNKIN